MFKQLKTLVSGTKKSAITVGAASALAAIAPLAHATAPDYSVIQNAVDWSTVATAILGIMALGATVIVAFIGGKFVLSAIKGAK